MKFAFNPSADLIRLPVRLHGPNGSLILSLVLDTGATSSVISWENMIELGYDPAGCEKRVPITTGSGIEFVPKLTVEKIEALGQERANFTLLCHTFPPSSTVDGALGLDFLRGLRLIVDFRAGAVSLE